VFWVSDARVMARGKPVDASAAKVALRMLDVGMQRKTVAELCDTSVSSIDRVRQHAERNNGEVRDPKPGTGKQNDPRWHFAGPQGVLNTGLLDRIASGMDDSSSLEEIYDAYCILSSRTTRSTCPSRSASAPLSGARASS